jgi:hyperosmotically inducible protein
MKHDHSIRFTAFLPATLAVAAALALGACSKSEPDKTVGQKVDSAIASVERAAAETKADVKDAAATASADMKEAGASAKQTAQEAGAAVAGTARDIAITAKVNAELARDELVSPIRISVDTKDGHVALMGSTPTSAARERAQKVAAGVEGVVAVDNQLKVVPKS